MSAFTSRSAAISSIFCFEKFFYVLRGHRLRARLSRQNRDGTGREPAFSRRLKPFAHQLRHHAPETLGAFPRQVLGNAKKIFIEINRGTHDWILPN